MFSVGVFFLDGTVWTAGRGSYGRLGHHGTQNVPVFHPVEGLPSIQAIALGPWHCVALTLDDQVDNYSICTRCSRFVVRSYALVLPDFTQIDQYHCIGNRGKHVSPSSGTR